MYVCMYVCMYYIYNPQTPYCVHGLRSSEPPKRREWISIVFLMSRLDLYKIFVYVKSFCARANHHFLAPPHLHCPHCCNTVTRPLRNIRSPPNPPFVCYTPYTILGVLAIPCKSQVTALRLGAAMYLGQEERLN